jgi:hypothetical protein
VLPLLATLLAGVLDESAQRLFLLRVGDWRDVLLNLFAAVCGLLFAWIFEPPTGLPWSRRGGGARIAFALALALFAVGAFLVYAHLGFEIDDPETGRFRSSYPADELPRVAGRRAAEWESDPPIGLKPWDLKDPFLDEAARQLNYRNDRYQAGDWPAARQANRILELFYPPFLGAASSVSLGVNRWPAEVRAEVETKAAGQHAASLVSPVLRGHLLPWPRGLFFAGWLGAAGLVAALGFWLRARAG